MKVNLEMTNSMDKANIFIIMEGSTKVNGWIIWKKDRGN
jgi:hypothetical protein